MASGQLGARETIRRPGLGTRTLRPTSSVTSRKAGAPEETVGALCAREGAAQDKKAARAAQAALRRRGQASMFMNLPRPEILRNNKKAPRDTLGLAASLFLAKSTALISAGGWPGLRHFSRSQWRVPRRFIRPSPPPPAAQLILRS